VPKSGIGDFESTNIRKGINVMFVKDFSWDLLESSKMRGINFEEGRKKVNW
jgi:hypothetical protein